MADCYDGFRAALKNDFNEDDIEEAISRTKDLLATAKKEGANVTERLIQHAEQMKQDHEFLAAQKEFYWWRQQETINKIVQLINNFRGRKDAIFKALKSYTDGTEFNVPGARNSFSLVKQRMHNKIFGTLFTKLKENGVLNLWNSKQFQEDFVKALEGNSVDNPEIKKLGDTISEIKELIDNLDKKNGIFHNKLEGRFFRNFHSKKLMNYTADDFQQRLKDRSLPVAEQREKAFNRWRDFVKPRLDVQRSFGEHLTLEDNEDEINDILSGVYDQLIDQKEFKGQSDDIVSLSRKQRVLIWKDAKGAVEYNEKFGTGHTSSALEAEFQAAARRNAVLEHYGDKPIQTMQAAVLRSEKIFPDLKGDFDKVKDFDKIKRLYLEARGVTRDPNYNVAKASSTLKTFTNVTKLGSSFFSLLSDLSPATVQNRRIHGNFLKSAFNTLTTTVKSMSPGERKKFGDLLERGANANMGGNSRTFMDQGDSVGTMSRMQRLYFKAALHTPWDEGNRSAQQIQEAGHLANFKNKSFDQIKAADTELQRKFQQFGGPLAQGESTVSIAQQYGITPTEWDAIRSAPVKLVDGKQYIFPENAQEASDEKILDALKAEGIGSFDSDAQKRRLIQDKKDEIEKKFENYFIDREDHTIFRPGAADRQRLFFNTESGTAAREAVSLLTQFRMYPMTWVTKAVAPLIYGKGADSFWEAMFKGKADYLGLVQLMSSSWVLRYLGLAGAALAAGKSIPDPFDSETIKRSAFEGLGIYADLISSVGQNNEMGTYREIVGPNISGFVDNSRLIYNALFGKFSGLQAVNFLQQNTPAANLWAIKYATDYLLFNRMKEAVSPGYFEKKRRELEKHGQHYILPPV